MFGDIHLEDVKEYREKLVSKYGLKPIFPIWGQSSNQLISEFLHTGYKTIITCVDGKRLNSSLAGRVIDESFLKELPEEVDPCGEFGEFHTFVFDGPLFKKRIEFEVSKEITNTIDLHTNTNRFYFIDLIPKNE